MVRSKADKSNASAYRVPKEDTVSMVMDDVDVNVGRQDSWDAADGSESSSLEAALMYAEKWGFSIIPIRQDKRPYIKWQEYQKRRATREEIEQWWRDWPDAMIGIVTGKVSNLFVIDCDTREGYEAVEKHLPDSLEVPVARTPRGGWHLYFRYPCNGVTVGTKVLPGVDYRGEGGYIIAPPSTNGDGGTYRWQEELGIANVNPPVLPDSLLKIIINTYKNDSLFGPPSTCDLKMFYQGRRDNDLFHTACCLFKGGMPESEVRQVLVVIAKSCNPPFPEHEIETKLQSALKHYQQRERNIAAEVREWVAVTSGYFSTTEMHKELQPATRQERRAMNAAVRRLREEGILERHGDKNGMYRRVERNVEKMDYMNAPTEEFSLALPLGIDGLCKIYPGNVIVVAGAKSAGKTAFLLNVVKDNMDKYPIVYMNSEMGDSELRLRLELFEGLRLEDWRFEPIIRHEGWSDLITHERKIWIVDYLEPPAERVYLVGDEIRAIHGKLKNGICIVAIQKQPDRDLGYGKTFSMEKARLYLALDPGRIKIVDAKAWRQAGVNPRGLCREFKLVAGSKFIPSAHWDEDRNEKVIST